MKVKRKEWAQVIPRPLPEVWRFFSRPENLNAITPEDMSFEIRSDIGNVEMYPGMLIIYRIAPVLGIKLEWVTEITHIREQQYFVDEQRFGPYALWHHEHHFREVDGGVEMRDILHYKVPYGLIGALADTLFVDARIEEIFRYRQKAVENVKFEI